MKTSPFTHPPARLILDAVGLVLFALATYVTTTHLWDIINFYDEGLLLTGARMVSRGRFPTATSTPTIHPGFSFCSPLCGS